MSACAFPRGLLLSSSGQLRDASGASNSASRPSAWLLTGGPTGTAPVWPEVNSLRAPSPVSLKVVPSSQAVTKEVQSSSITFSLSNPFLFFLHPGFRQVPCAIMSPASSCPLLRLVPLFSTLVPSSLSLRPVMWLLSLDAAPFQFHLDPWPQRLIVVMRSSHCATCLLEIFDTLSPGILSFFFGNRAAEDAVG